MSYKPTVSVDFDGVLHSYTSGWTGVVPEDAPEPGALGFIHALINTGYEVVVVSSRCRENDGAAAIRDWMSEHGFPPLKVSGSKVPAIAYVDDRAVRYEIGTGDFDTVLDEVEQLRDLNKRRKK